EIPFIDLFTPTKSWFTSGKALTIDGVQLNNLGYQKLSKYLVDELFGGKPKQVDTKAILAAVKEKNWFWHKDYKIPNGVHVYGRRFEPFGSDNYPEELKKVEEMTFNRDSAIWAIAQDLNYDLKAADAKTTPLSMVESNYQPGDDGRGNLAYLYGEEALEKLAVAPGYKVELFASETEFPDLANPVQLSFDNKGRLWVATMPTYPHYRPGDKKPNDKLLILEDTDNDGKADKQTVWADGLHLPIGFEFAPEGVYIAQAPHLKLLSDTDGDDRMDKEEIIYSGFDDHDTHHAISAFCADPSGAIYMGEGVFLHTNVETPYGTVRATNGGFYRFAPQNRRLERTAQIPIPNPWGIAFDEWGQPIFAETSGPAIRWLLPSTIRPRYGRIAPMVSELVEEAHRVRPTSGLEFVYSRHFPDEVQGDFLVNNTIGFLGIKQHTFEEGAVGYRSRHRQDLLDGSDPNFRPVDMEFAPDGSLYVVDWHNVLIGHMQHNARDPYRDHVHGRVYRITYPSRPLIRPANIADAPIDTLLDNLKLPEYRTRYRTRRELRGRPAEEVLTALSIWVDELDQTGEHYEHYLLEALWVTWGLNHVDEALLKKVLRAKDHRARAAAVVVIRYARDQLYDPGLLLNQAAGDEHPRVRLAAAVAASWLPIEEGKAIIKTAMANADDDLSKKVNTTALAYLTEEYPSEKEEQLIATNL
ncbi:MAG: PVC-type heme-binding CxxCH protein, partial [Bacteroidota bacterium]